MSRTPSEVNPNLAFIISQFPEEWMFLAKRPSTMARWRPSASVCGKRRSTELFSERGLNAPGSKTAEVERKQIRTFGRRRVAFSWKE